MYSFSDVTYKYIVDEQPIGRLLFRQFCEESQPQFHRYNVFLDNIVSTHTLFSLHVYSFRCNIEHESLGSCVGFLNTYIACVNFDEKKYSLFTKF